MPAASGRTLRFTVKTTKGDHKLSFCPSGCKNERLHQISIKNVAIYEKQCAGGWGKDIVKNGGFEQNTCGTRACIWNARQLNADSALNPVSFWIQSPEIEIGRGNIYNSKLGDSWVSELDSNRNTCIQQKVPLQAGKALLEFDWAGRVRNWAGRVQINAGSSSFEVKLNGKILDSFKPRNDDLYQQDV